MRDRLLAEWPLKTLALVLAIVIWISIAGQDGTLRDFTVPLEINLGADRIAASPPPTAITVRLEGSRAAIRQLDPLRLAVRLDLTDTPLGSRELVLSPSNLSGVPRGVAVALFDPARVRVEVANRAWREFAIEPDLAGRPAPGHALYGHAVEPARVMLEGPESALAAIRKLRTESIPLDGRRESFVTRVGLTLPDARVRSVQADPIQVELWLDVAPSQTTFDGVAVELPFAPSGPPPLLRPGSVAVRLAGPPWLLEELAAAEIAAVAEVGPPGPERPTRVPLRVELRLAEERRRLLTVMSIKPTHVSVQVVRTAGG